MTSSIRSYRDLIAWQKAMKLTKEAYTLCVTFPSEEKYGLTSQIKRSAVSIPSNIAEGWGRNSDAQFRQFLNIASASLCELETLFEIGKDIELIPESKYNDLLSQTSEVSRIIRGLLNSLSGNYVNESEQEYFIN